LEHRERVARATVGQTDSACREDRELVVRRAGVHVDHSGSLVRTNLEDELAKVVDHPVPVFVLAQFARELSCPFRQVADVRHVAGYAAMRRVYDGRHGLTSHSSITPLSARLSTVASCFVSVSSTLASSSRKTSSATG